MDLRENFRAPPFPRASLQSSSSLHALQVGDKLSGTDGTEWTVTDIGPGNVGRRDAHNVFREAPGPSAFAKRHIHEGVVRSAWDLVITPTMLKHMKMCTENRAREESGDKDWSVSMDELEAFIAVLYARGWYGARNLELDFLWSKEWGPPFFSQTMSRDRFREIMRYLRFDLRTERSQRLRTDKFALCSDLWDSFIVNCNSLYKPGPELTVDEQLFPSKARCPFTQYMPNKLDKFGIKFWMLCDAKTKFMCNAMLYLGKSDERAPDVNLGEHVVLKLSESYMKKGRNITTDNYFTSVKLARALKAQQTSLVGTVNRKRREIPHEVKAAKGHRYSTVFLKNNDASLTVYQGKREKNVIVLSTMHPNITVGETEKRLPETIEVYNKNKAGVDSVDQMARLYSVRAATRRWPVHVFYNVLDIAAINAYILFSECTGEKISRHEFPVT